MQKVLRYLLALALLPLALPATAQAQTTPWATYITKQQWQAVGKLPGVDRQIVSRDIGKLNESVGIIHRDAVGPTAQAFAEARGDTGGGGNRQRPPTPDSLKCGVTSSSRQSGAGGILHEHQTETYVVVSGGGVLVTGGQILNGRHTTPESVVETTLNGPSCSGQIVGDYVSRYVTEGEIVIIPAGTPHGWLSIPDHVDYLSVRPDPDRVLSDHYINPALDGSEPSIRLQK